MCNNEYKTSRAKIRQRGSSNKRRKILTLRDSRKVVELSLLVTALLSFLFLETLDTLVETWSFSSGGASTVLPFRTSLTGLTVMLPVLLLPLLSLLFPVFRASLVVLGLELLVKGVAVAVVKGYTQSLQLGYLIKICTTRNTLTLATQKKDAPPLALALPLEPTDPFDGRAEAAEAL